jgi:hypothetical protein
MKKIILLIASSVVCSTLYASPTTYSYNVYLLPPFNKVTINHEQLCPTSPVDGGKCLVPQQTVGATILLTSIKDHACAYEVLPNGSLEKDEAQSFFCTGYTKSASGDAPGEIHLPKHF